MAVSERAEAREPQLGDCANMRRLNILNSVALILVSIRKTSNVNSSTNHPKPRHTRLLGFVVGLTFQPMKDCLILKSILLHNLLNEFFSEVLHSSHRNCIGRIPELPCPFNPISDVDNHLLYGA